MVLGLRLHSLAFGLQPLTPGLPAVCPRLPLAQNFHSDVAATFLRWKCLVSGAVSGVDSGADPASFPAPFLASFPAPFPVHPALMPKSPGCTWTAEVTD